MSQNVLPKAGPVELTEEQVALREAVESQLAEIRSKMATHLGGHGAAIRKLGDDAHILHMSLAASGNTPRHHKYMIQNRGMEPSDPEFYHHIHPVEDLLKFISDRSANADPEDRTLNAEFEFRVYSRRWDHDESYQVVRTKNGWRFNTMGLGDVATGRDGRVRGQPATGVFAFLDHDSINYPEELPGYLEWLWRRAAGDGLTRDQVQGGLSQLADWVRVVEKHSPAGLFQGYK